MSHYNTKFMLLVTAVLIFMCIMFVLGTGIILWDYFSLFVKQ